MEQGGLLRRGFAVTTAAGLASVAIAEYVIGTMVVLAKDLHQFGRMQQEHKWDFRFTGELAGKTVGILGLGEIGRETARRAGGPSTCGDRVAPQSLRGRHSTPTPTNYLPIRTSTNCWHAPTTSWWRCHSPRRRRA